MRNELIESLSCRVIEWIGLIGLIGFVWIDKLSINKQQHQQLMSHDEAQFDSLRQQALQTPHNFDEEDAPQVGASLRDRGSSRGLKTNVEWIWDWIGLDWNGLDWVGLD